MSSLFSAVLRTDLAVLLPHCCFHVVTTTVETFSPCGTSLVSFMLICDFDHRVSQFFFPSRDIIKIVVASMVGKGRESLDARSGLLVERVSGF